MSKPNENEGKLQIWQNVLGAALKIPGAKINRADFLRTQLKNRFDEEIVNKAIESRPALAGIPSEDINELADSCIGWHTVQSSAISFAAGLPGGWFLAGTIPADLAQFYWHTIVLSQKLAYLYGWPELLENDVVDDETIQRLTLFIGVMMGAQEAGKIIIELAEKFAGQVAVRLPRQALTKVGGYVMVKQIGKWIGIQITKSTFARGISKVVPIIGGLVSAAVTAAAMVPMAKTLQDHLKKLKYAKGR